MPDSFVRRRRRRVALGSKIALEIGKPALPITNTVAQHVAVRVCIREEAQPETVQDAVRDIAACKQKIDQRSAGQPAHLRRLGCSRLYENLAVGIAHFNGVDRPVLVAFSDFIELDSLQGFQVLVALAVGPPVIIADEERVVAFLCAGELKGDLENVGFCFNRSYLRGVKLAPATRPANNRVGLGMPGFAAPAVGLSANSDRDGLRFFAAYPEINITGFSAEIVVAGLRFQAYKKAIRAQPIYICAVAALEVGGNQDFLILIEEFALLLNAVAAMI